MRRLWLRWALLIVFVVALGFVFVRLGDWQLDRLDQRRERNASTLNNEQSPVEPAADVFTRTIEEPDQWRNVRATGTFDAQHQFVVRYRQNGDDSGYQVVTPLRLSAAGGLTVLVDRGFVALGSGQPIPTVAPPPPTGEVTVEGHVRRNEQGNDGAVRPEAGQVRLINSDALQSALPYPVANGYLSVVTIDPAQSGGFEPIPPPDLSEGPHFWYAVQWFMFTGIAVLGIVVFIRGDLRDRRAAATAAGRRLEPDRHVNPSRRHRRLRRPSRRSPTMAESDIDDDLWNEFHRVVNMSSRELQEWLLTREAHENSEGLPDQAGSETGRHVLAILRKRRTDLTADDARVMRHVVDRVLSQRRDDLEPVAGEAHWRYRLMSLGHDPLKPAD